ncbi:MAG: hypothetical protein Kow001_22770 [Acidobacteriota bacterium]
MSDRRSFLKGAAAAAMAAASRVSAAPGRLPGPANASTGEAQAVVYRALNGGAPRNLAKVLELMGGVERLFGADDIVVIKPNVQWWNQGAPNLAATRTLVELIFNRPGGFRGEVVLAENCHRGARPWLSEASGWARTFERNAGLGRIRNFHQLAGELKQRYGDRFTVSHWINVAAGARRVAGPQDGPGYVFCDGTLGVPLLDFHNGLSGQDSRRVLMTYPIFRTDRGTMVDFRYGVWERGSYTGRPLRFVNLAALNHHSTYCGATSAIKNFLGVTDLSGGPDPYHGGRLAGDYYNFHSFPFDKWAPGPRPGMIGAEIGFYMQHIRRPDLNITTAEWIGLASRTEAPVVRTGAVLASTDAVALDHHATKYLLYFNSRVACHNPDDPESPQRQYLEECARQGGGVLEESRVKVESFDFRSGRREAPQDLSVTGQLVLGRHLPTILKYWWLRMA